MTEVILCSPISTHIPLNFMPSTNSIKIYLDSAMLIWSQEEQRKSIVSTSLVAVKYLRIVAVDKNLRYSESIFLV